jgi:hypothetical protein
MAGSLPVARLPTVSLRAVLLGTWVAIVVLGLAFALAFGPALYTTVTGRPLFLLCGDATPTQCDEALGNSSEQHSGRKHGSPPVIYFRFDPDVPPPGTCGSYTLTRGWNFFDARSWSVMPFC